ncbi:MAG: hypothetical protein JWO36_6391 [Myxococcales bacterium]|nr:hypothetical protein [Myxococcales bacterium]
MKGALFVAVVCACGGSSAPAKPTAVAKPAPPRQITAEMFCSRFTKLKNAGCAMFEKMDLDHEACLKQLDDPTMAPFRNTFGPCFVDHDSCDTVAACISDAAAPKLDQLRTCDNHDVQRAVGVPAAEWAHRKGANVKKLADARSSKAQPIEICGIKAENEWLVNATCENGSHPFQTRSDAEAARFGNVGEGGRCGSIIDLYKVKCVEQTYDVFIDGYVCPLPK